MWDIVSNCTVGLTADTNREHAEQIVCESQTEEEALLDQFTDDLYSGTNCDSENNNNTTNTANSADGDDVADVEEVLDPATLRERRDEDIDEDKEYKIDLTETQDETEAMITAPGIGGRIRVCANVKHVL